MTTLINASPTNGLVQTADGSGVLKVQSNGVTTNALAWVNFAGASGTRAANYNVSSVTRSATGTYAVAFTTATTDANYAIVATCQANSGNAQFTEVQYNVVPTTSGFTVRTWSYAGTLQDVSNVYVAVFGN